MRILFAGKQHFSIGGVESDTDQLARHLVRDHAANVVVVASRRDAPLPPGTARLGRGVVAVYVAVLDEV